MKTRETSQDRVLSFGKRALIDDGEGNSVGGFAEAFREKARLIFAGGGEGVESARLEGRETMKCRVRSNASTQTLTTDDLAVDVETNQTFAVISVDRWTQKGWVWLRIQSGVAA